jgi:transposase
MSKRSKGKRTHRNGKAVLDLSLPSIRPLVAGIDIGSREHWVCGPALPDGRANVRVFRTTTPALNEMADWLIEQGVESVAMESTHVYWVPVFELLESRGIEVVLVNARQLHHVPGRKTDMQDCQWLQKLHSCGLLRGSFRPCESIVRMRALQRQRRQLIEQQSRAVQWMQKALDQMNVQVHRALTDITGKTGMLIVRAIVAGERDPLKLAQFRDPRCKNSQEQIAKYLTGTWRDEHVFNLASASRLYDTLQVEIDTYDRRIRQLLVDLQPEQRENEPVPAHPNPGKERAIRRRGEHELRTELWRFAGCDLTCIDGISPDTAAIILTEVGCDLSAFPNENHFVSWLRLSPRRQISGGKQLRKRPNGTGSNRVAGALRIAALSLHRSKTALGASYRRIARRKDAKTAIFATARKLAHLVFRTLKYGHHYLDVGERAFEERFRQNHLNGLRRAATALGYTLIPEPSKMPSQ